MEKKINILPENGKVLIGSHFHVLEDQSFETFQTDDITAFRQFIKDNPEKMNGGTVYYNHERATVRGPDIDRRCVRLAVLNLTRHNALTTFLNISNSVHGLETFEKYLKKLKRYLNEDGLLMYAHTRDFTLKSVTNFQRKKERNGDFVYHLSFENKEKESFQPPEKIGFTVPVFNHIETEMNFILDVEFSHRIVGEEINLNFEIFDPALDEAVQKAQREIMESELKEIELPKYWGGSKITEENDAWKYKTNTINI